MKLGSVFVTAVLAAGATASWLSSAGKLTVPIPPHHRPVLEPQLTHPAYNKWHETELERWLSDHNVPYPAAATRNDLESLVRDNWHDNVVAPYQGWDASQLRSYLQAKGQQAKDTQEGLVDQVKGSWYETEDKSQQAWGDVRDWIFDTWTDSELKEFCDKHGITVPQPRNRDVLISKVRANYDSAAKKAGETAAYPGDWLYESWSGECPPFSLAFGMSGANSRRLGPQVLARQVRLQRAPDWQGKHLTSHPSRRRSRLTKPSATNSWPPSAATRASPG